MSISKKDFTSALVKKNRFIEMVTDIRRRGESLYIWGDGLGGRQVAFLLDSHDISYDGFAVNKSFYRQKTKTVCLEELCEHSKEHSLNLVVAFRGFTPDIINKYQHKINRIIDMDVWAGLTHYHGETAFTYQWVLNNRESLQFFYESLQDDLSKQTLCAYCNQKISMEYGYLEPFIRPHQYFDDDIINLTSQEVFIDYGAYTGDSAADFVSALHVRGIKTYDRIISFEPSHDNFLKLCSRQLNHHQCIEKAVGAKQGFLYFDDEKDSSRTVASASFRIELDTIDSVLRGSRATQIKMDIEGEELNALKGAVQTIKTWKPVLALCVYHKPEDLLEIPRFVKELVPSYKFWLRCYEKTATELVLYAVP